MGEQRLVAEMAEEIRSGNVRTCILYPTKDAPTVEEWKSQIGANASSASSVAEKESETTKAKGKSSSSSTPEGIQLPRPQSQYKYRLIALDGTYKEASRMYRHLERCLHVLLGEGEGEGEEGGEGGGKGEGGVQLPVAKLDLGESGIASAYLGLQNQPDKNKICTYQACVLAFRQLGESSETCDWLDAQLHQFIEYVLASDIKHAKPLHKSKKWRPDNLEESQAQVKDYVLVQVSLDESYVFMYLGAGYCSILYTGGVLFYVEWCIDSFDLLL